MSYSHHYRANEISDDVTPLTTMQRLMAEGDGYSIYRKPFLYALPSYIHYKSFSQALYRTIHNQVSMQVKILKIKHDLVQYVDPLPPIEQWYIPIVNISVSPEQYIRENEQAISIFEGYLWRVKYLQYKQKRYLYIEFHGIIMDDYGIKSFEDSLFQSMVNTYQLPNSNLLSFRLMKNMENIVGYDRKSIMNCLLPQRNRIKINKMSLISYQLNSDQLEVIKRIRNCYKVDFQVVFQLIIEQTLGSNHDGQIYGIFDNLRFTLRNFDEAGCFTYVNKQRLQGLQHMRGRLALLHMQQQRRKEGKFGAASNLQEVSVVYSYEEKLYKFMKEIFADQYSNFELVIRVQNTLENTIVSFEYKESEYTEEYCHYLQQRLIVAIELMRQQLLVEYAS